MTYFLDLRATSRGGFLADDITPRSNADTITPAALNAAARGRDLLLVAHGFNVDRDDGMKKLSWWEQRLQLDASALFVGILWPGDSAWLPAIDYPIEGNEAVASGRMLGPFLVANFAEATSLSFVSHSLGARVMLETIRQLKERRPVRSLTLMAGAIDDDCLADEYRDAAGAAGAISVLASKGDTVLEYAFPIGNLFSGIIARGHPYWHAALGREGPDSPYPYKLRPLWQIPDRWAYRHGDYFGDVAPSADRIAQPVNVPPQDTPPPVTPLNWQPEWSAAFAATRFRS